MNVFCLMLTCGRHRCAERALTCFIKQDYTGEHTLLIHNNSPMDQSLAIPGDLPHNKHITLINRSRPEGYDGYSSLGAIYNDTVKMVPPQCDIICFWDDDDLYLPDHISKGVEGYKRALAEGSKAYKPMYSFFNHSGQVSLTVNNMEPSIFVDVNHIRSIGFKDTTTDQHLQWLSGLGNQILVDPGGTPTLVYNWGDDIPTFKTSGNPGPDNFNNYREFSQDHGDGVLSPIPDKDLQKYYDQVIVPIEHP